MILKFRINTNFISSWGFEQAEEIYVHKQFANKIKSNHRFYETNKVKSLEAFDNGTYPIINKIVLISEDQENTRYICIPVSGSEVYLLTDSGKTIERL